MQSCLDRPCEDFQFAGQRVTKLTLFRPGLEKPILTCPLKSKRYEGSVGGDTYGRIEIQVYIIILIRHKR